MAGIRPLTRADLPAVVALRKKVWPESIHGCDEARAAYLGRVFLDNPWRDGDIVPLVAEDDHGVLVGFHGAIPRPARFGSRRIRVAVGESFVVDPKHRGLVGIQLLRRFLEGPQDLSIADRATPGVARLWRHHGGHALELQRLDWIRPFYPLRVAARRVAGEGSSLWGVRAASPFLGALDTWVTGGASELRVLEPEGHAEPVDLDAYASALRGLESRRTLMPEGDAEGLKWLAGFWSDRREFGPWETIVVRSASHEVAGAFLWMLRGRVAELVHLVARPDARGTVLEHFLTRARASGARVCQGRVDAHLVDLIQPPAYFLDQLTDKHVVVHSDDARLIEAIRDGSSQLGRLDGAWFTRF